MTIETPTLQPGESAPAPARARFSPLDWLRRNPVALKEFRGRMRGNRAFVLLTIYLGLMVFIIGSVYLLYLASISDNSYYGVATVSTRSIFGKTLFALVLGIQMFCVCLIAPALTAGSITSERERQTFDLLRTTLLTERELVMGKFLSGFGFILLMLVASLPLESLAFLFGGVTPEEVLVNAVLLVTTAASFCAVGIFCSSFFRTSVLSTVMAYAIPLLWVYGIPAFLLGLAAVFSGLIGDIFNTSSLTAVQEAIFFYGLWTLISFNPVATMIATETLAITNQTLWAFDIPLSGSSGVSSLTSITVLSPWILYTVLALLVTLLLLLFSMGRMRRVET